VATPDTLEGALAFAPLYPDETQVAIRSRWVGWANEGLDPQEDVDQWTDTREGSHWWMQTAGAIREFERLYDLMGSEVPSSVLPQYSWGAYLDDQAELRNIGRLVSTAAEGVVELTGTAGTVVDAGTVVGVEPETETANAPEFQTTASVTLPAPPAVAVVPVRASVTGSAGNVAAHAIKALVTPVPEIATVDNPSALVGGTDVEADSALKARVLESYLGVAVANQAYYRTIALRQAGVGRATVITTPDGPGTIEVIIATAEGDPVGDSVVAELQATLDPIAGQGAGAGQVGATITVSTAQLILIEVYAEIEPEIGYSLDGDPGTVALREDIERALETYIRSVDSGGEVLLARVIARLVSVRGVHDVTSVFMVGAQANGNFLVPQDPPRAPMLGTLHLSTPDPNA
jgi:uncharacterized phage protein gp47/JayE